ncbi:NfeD family protein [Rhodopirellula sp. JC639]|uniref:NfeD family protein n=1 Tax=Stieleria mannarensis TaxID=2755585 RepID=UPI0015FFDDC2|nr:NfeD family protein [Rhodopirellula sp. JC639]
MPLTYSLALLALFFVLLVGEFFIPSAGMVGVAAAIAGTTSIVIAFTHSATAGFAVTTTVMGSTPLVLYLMIRFWPHSPIGKLILNRRPGQLDEPTESRLRSGEKRKDLVGHLGVAKTNLLPSGLVVIDGKRLDAVSDGSPIDAGTPIVVISAVAGKLRVRAAERSDIEPEQVEVERRTDAIEATLESLDLEDLDD